MEEDQAVLLAGLRKTELSASHVGPEIDPLPLLDFGSPVILPPDMMFSGTEGRLIEANLGWGIPLIPVELLILCTW